VILGSYVPTLARAAAAQAAMVATNPFLLLVTAIGAATFALSAFGDQIHPVAGDMANLQDYAGAAWDTISNGAMTAASTINGTLITAINFIADAVSGSKVSFADLGDFVKQVLNTLIGSFMLLYDRIVVTFTELPAAIAEAVVNAMNAMIAAVEDGLNGVINAVNSTIESLNGVGESVGVSLGTIGNVTLSRIENTYAGAGEKAGKAYGDALRRASQDHIGNALGAWREAANERAQNRAADQPATAEIDSVDNPTRPAGASGGGGSGRRGGGAGNDFQRQVAQLQQRTAALRAETDARRGLTGSIEEQAAAVEKAKLKHDLLTAAQNAGMAITPQLEAQVDQLAAGYMDASQEAKRLEESQRAAQQQAQEWANFAGGLVSGFVNDLRQGKSASEALANAVGKITDKLIDMAVQMLIVKPLMGLFGFSGGGLVGGFPPAPAPAGLYADGGHVRGPGTSTSDSIPARLSNGEYVVRAAAVKKIGVSTLDALNYGGMLPGYADGGYVGDAPSIRRPDLVPANSNAAPVQNITISAPVTVNAQGGDPSQNADLAKQVGRQMEQQMRGLVADELRRQARPGNYMNTRSR